MASTINDYTLELQWKGNKVLEGLEKIEKKLATMAVKAERLERVANPTTKLRVQQQQTAAMDAHVQSFKRMQKAEWDAMKIEKERLATMSALDARIRRMADAAESAPKGARGDRLRAEMEHNIKKLREFQSEWTKTRVRSQKDILAMKTAMRPLIDATDNAARAARRAAKQYGFLGEVGKRALASVTSGLAAGIGFYALANLGREAYKSAKEFDKMEVAMQAGFGSAKRGAEELEYVRKVSKDMAIDLYAAGEGWAKIGLAAQASGRPMSQARSLFENLSIASRSFGLTADDTKGAMRAVVQMLSKGKITAEDFTGQLAERMPGALALLQKATGMTDEAFADAYQNGGLTLQHLEQWAAMQAQIAKDSGAFAKSLMNMEAGATLLKNELKEASRTLFKSGLDQSLGRMNYLLSQFVSENQDTINAVGNTIGAVVDGFSWAVEILSPLVNTIFDGWSLIHGLFVDAAALGKLSLYDYSELDGLQRWAYAIVGLFHDVANGWRMIVSAFQSFTIPKALEDLDLILKDIQNGWNYLTGGEYTNDMGEKEQGWRADATDWAGSRINEMKSTVSNSVSNAGDTVYNLTINGMNMATEGVEGLIESIMGEAATNAMNPTGD